MAVPGFRRRVRGRNGGKHRARRRGRTFAALDGGPFDAPGLRRFCFARRPGRLALAVLRNGGALVQRGRQARRERLRRSRCGRSAPAAHVVFHHKVCRTAHHDQVLDIVAADENKLPAAFDAGAFQHRQAADLRLGLRTDPQGGRPPHRAEAEQIGGKAGKNGRNRDQPAQRGEAELGH